MRWQTHSHTQGATAGDDGYFVHRVALGQQLADQGVAGLVVRRIAALALRHDHALALGAHQDFVFRFFEILHFHQARVAPRSHQSGFVAQICQIRTRHAGRSTRNHAGIDILRHRHFAHMHIQNLLTPANIGQRYVHLAVKTAWAQKRRIQNIGAIGGRNHDDTDIGLKTVHLHQHLVERLLTFVIATAQTGTALASDRVNLVDKDDARCVLFGVVKHVAYPRCAHTNEHFHKIGAGDAEKRHFGFTSDRLGQQRFAGSGWADQQQTPRDAPAQFLEFAGVFQEINDFFNFFLGFVATGDVGKSHGIRTLVEQASLALTETESAAFTAALHLAHEINPHANQQQHGAPADQ